MFLRQAPGLGMDADELTSAAGLSREQLSKPDAQIPLVKIQDLWRAMIARSPEQDLGLRIGCGLTIREMGLVGYAMYYSASLLDALDRFSRYCRIIAEGNETTVIREPGLVGVVCEFDPRLAELGHPIDARLAGLVTVAREITGTEVVPVEVLLPYKEPADLTAHRRAFRAPLFFDRPHAALIFRREDADLAVVAGDKTLSGYLDELAESVVSSLPSHESFAGQVRRDLWTSLSAGRPTIGRTAKRLGVSARALQRHLNREGTSFTRILASLRREMVVVLLRDPSLAISEVAFLLGYTESSAFHRAFRGWYKTTPHEFRAART
jgi:AraC-like DNA-binding protein